MTPTQGAGSAYDTIRDALLERGRTVTETGPGTAKAQCPAHDDHTPSLSIGPRSDGKGVVLYCFTGCTYRDVLAKLGLTDRDLFDDATMRAVFNPRRDYRYPGGRVNHRNGFTPDGGKKFWQEHAEDHSLFGADDLGDPDAVIYLCEGEKAAEMIRSIGGVAVATGGSNRRCDLSPLGGRHVTVIADRDTPGRTWASTNAEGLLGVAASVTVMQAAVDIDKADAVDHIAAGLGLDHLVEVDWWATPVNPGVDGNGDGDNTIDPAQFFGRDGLRARDVADAVMDTITCGFSDIDERFYTYSGGVWLPGSSRIIAEITRQLGNRYRSSHARNVLDMIRYSPDTRRITREPLPDYINVANGMIDWRTGELLPHSPDHLSTVQLPVDYDPDATCPAFDRFLADVLPHDCYEATGDSPEGFIWELIGYALYSGNPLHIAVLLYGCGRNGKGTLIRVLKRLIGDHNISTVGLHELCENRFRTATLFGKLANLAGDLDSRWLANTATFKAITGGDAIQGEHKYGAVFDFTPWALPVYSTNKAFGSADSSEGWVARWVVVPFPANLLGREDRTLESRLLCEAELRGILARSIRALPAVMSRGRLQEPTSVAEAKAAFVTSSDAVRSWLEEACTLDAEAWTPRTHLYNAYRLHADSDGSKRLSARELYNRLDQISGVEQRIHRGTRGFCGIRLTQPSDRQEQQPPHGAQGVEGAGSPPPVRPHRGKGEETAPTAPWASGLWLDEPDDDPDMCWCGYPPPSGRTEHYDCERKRTETSP